MDYSDDLYTTEIIELYFKGKNNYHPAEIAEHIKKDENITNIDEYWKKYYNNLPLSVIRLFNYPYNVQGSKEWLSDSGIVTSATVASIIDENIHQTSDDCFLLQTNQIPPIYVTDAMRSGIIQEPHTAQKAANRLNEKFFLIGSIKWDKNKNISVSCDRISSSGYNVELKTPYYDRVYEDENIDFLLENKIYYYHQVQLQMLVTGLKKTWFVRYGCAPNKNHCSKPLFDKEILSCILVPFDEQWWPRYEKKINQFIDRVLEYRKNNPDWNKRKWTVEESYEYSLKNRIY